MLLSARKLESISSSLATAGLPETDARISDGVGIPTLLLLLAPLLAPVQTPVPEGAVSALRGVLTGVKLLPNGLTGEIQYVSELYSSRDEPWPLLVVEAVVVLMLSVCFLCERGNSCFLAAKPPALLLPRSVDEVLGWGPGGADKVGELSSSIR